MFRTLAALTTALLTASSTTAFAQTDAVAEFYRGKTVRLVIGYGAAAATTSTPRCSPASSASTSPASRP